VRWGLLLTPLALGAVLLRTAWSSRERVHDATAMIDRGQASLFVQAAAEGVGRGEADPTREDLAAVLEEHDRSGLKYIGAFDRDGTLLVEVGTPSGPVDLTARRPPVSTERVGERERIILRGPPPRGRRGDLRRSRRRGPIVIEYEPKVSHRLRAQAGRAFWSSAATAALLMLIATALWRVLRRQAHEAEAMERERRLAALGEMSAVLAHEMRNPLASLKGHAQLLAEQLDPQTRPGKKVSRVLAEAQRLEDLSATLLDFVRADSAELQSVNPAELVRECAESVSSERIAVDADGAPPSWQIDPLRMRQVLSNLMQNALQASPEDQSVEVRVAKKGSRLVISVRDHGEGLPAGAEQRIFDAFHTTRIKGTGLGLAIARRIVELHNGQLTGENHREGGALFTITLPR
jgi:two-component system sensor histidine kinase HydH